jgi:hypothetical protein
VRDRLRAGALVDRGIDRRAVREARVVGGELRTVLQVLEVEDRQQQ